MDKAGATLIFAVNSTAGEANIYNGLSDITAFTDNASAGSATLRNQGTLYFTGDGNGVNFSTASSAQITNNGVMFFNDYATADNAVITTNSGGSLSFAQLSTGGNCQLTANGTGYVDFSQNQATAVTVGSIAGSGTYYLGSLNLTTGGDNLSTTVTGLITDGGAGAGSDSSLTKTGTGTFTLTGKNSYSGGTTLNEGTLNVGNDGALGGGLLTLEDGTLLQVGLNNLTLNNAVSLTGSTSFDSNGNNSILLGLISGEGSLTKIGSGSLTLTGANDFSGGTSIDGGVLVLANDNALGLGSVNVNGGTLALNSPRTANILGNYNQTSTGSLQLGLLGITPGPGMNSISRARRP